MSDALEEKVNQSALTEYLKLLSFVIWRHILTLDVDAYKSP